MFEDVYSHFNGAPNGKMSVDDMFGYNVRYQVLVRNQEEKDYLLGLQLIYGREIQVDTWDEWRAKCIAFKPVGRDNPYGESLRLLPIVFTTRQDLNLRGL